MGKLIIHVERDTIALFPLQYRPGDRTIDGGGEALYTSIINRLITNIQVEFLAGQYGHARRRPGHLGSIAPGPAQAIECTSG